MNKTISIVAAVFMMCIAACKNNNQPMTADQVITEAAKAPGLNAGIGTYSIHAPDGWVKKDTSMNGIKILFVYAPADAGADFHPNINIISEAMSGLSFENYVKQNMQTMQQYIANFHVIDSGSIQANDMQGRWVHYTQSMNGQELENIFYILPKNDIAYGLTSTTRKGDMDTYRNDFESIVKTLQVQ